MLLAASVVPRRRYPVAAFAVAAVIAAAQIGFGVGPGQAPVFALQPTNADIAILVLLYTLAAYRPRRVSIAGLVVCLLGSAVALPAGLRLTGRIRLTPCSGRPPGSVV